MLDNGPPLCYNGSIMKKQKKMKEINSVNVILGIRKPLSTRAGHPIGTRSGKKGYDRRDKKRELRQIIREF
jgi:hypothetical protein